MTILNFHYAWPEAATLNAGLGRVVGFDETGFASPSDRVAAPETDAVYRRQAWEFLMAGGGIFSMLDYSFAVGHEDGTLVNRAPGGGSPALRRQLRVLKDFLHSFDIPGLKPRPGVVEASPGAFTRALGTKKRCGVYVRGDGRTVLRLDLPKGDWREEWIDTKTGAVAKTVAFSHNGGRREVASPPYERDIALRLVRGRRPLKPGRVIIRSRGDGSRCSSAGRPSRLLVLLALGCGAVAGRRRLRRDRPPLRGRREHPPRRPRRRLPEEGHAMGPGAAVPVDQSGTSAVRKAFSEAVLGMPVATAVQYWQKQMFRTNPLRPPAVKGSDAEVIAFVAKTEGAVGYVSKAAALPPG